MRSWSANPPRPGWNRRRRRSRQDSRSVEWHLAISGQQTGPFGLAALVTRILAAERGDEVYVWNEHLDGWKEPKLIPEVAAEMRLRAAAQHPPSPPCAPPRCRPRLVCLAHGRQRPPSRWRRPAPARRSDVGPRGRSSAAMAAIDHFAPSGEEEKTQISAAGRLAAAGDPGRARPSRAQPTYKSGAQPAVKPAAPGHWPPPRRVTQEVSPNAALSASRRRCRPATAAIRAIRRAKPGPCRPPGSRPLDFSPSLRAPSRPRWIFRARASAGEPRRHQLPRSPRRPVRRCRRPARARRRRCRWPQQWCPRAGGGWLDLDAAVAGRRTRHANATRRSSSRSSVVCCWSA